MPVCSTSASRRAPLTLAAIAAPSNLHAAWLAARRGKRFRPDVAAFAFEAEDRLREISERILAGVWRPRGYRVLRIDVPKRRLITAAPFADRVVHQAIHRQIAPSLHRRFTDDTFACLPGRGTHRAVLRFQALLRRHAWIGRVDVRRFFLELRWSVIRAALARDVVDPSVRSLIDHILVSGEGIYRDPALLRWLGIADAYTPEAAKGLPIGNLTSQLFANASLSGLDHFVKRQLRAPGYIRYMDDMAVFGQRHGEVRRWVEAMQAWLLAERGLPSRAIGRVAACRGHFRFLGYSVSRTERRLARSTARRLRARARDAALSGDVEAGERIGKAAASLPF